MVARLRAAGAILIGKTNVPEFGLGSHSFNSVYGVTSNAYDPARSGGGSSGGAAVAVALRMQPVADGTDHAGSLRNPPAFNNLYGLRTCWGGFRPKAKMSSVPASRCTARSGEAPPISGSCSRCRRANDPRCPNSIRQDPGGFSGPLGRDFRGVRIAWLGDFGGRIPFEPGVLETGQAALAAFAEIGCQVEEAVPSYDIERLWQDWLVLRAMTVASALRPLVENPTHRAQMKPEAIWEAERGFSLTADQVAEALEGRTRWYETLRRFMDVYDFLVMPSAQVFPFDKTIRWPSQVGGQAMDTYHRWMQISLLATMAGLPALAIPAGFGPGAYPRASKS